jgi:hypothetical protein
VDSVFFNSTVETIWKNVIKIIRAFEQNGFRVMWFQKFEWSDIVEALVEYFKQERSDSVPIIGPVIMINYFLINFNFKLIFCCLNL